MTTKTRNEVVLTAALFRTWGICYDPERYWDDDWSGSIVDVLKDDRVLAVERIWLASHALDSRQLRLFGCWCAREALKVVHRQYQIDPRFIDAVDVAERFAHGQAAENELSAACNAARDVAKRIGGSAARYAANSAVWSAARSVAESAAGSFSKGADKIAARIAARRQESSAAFRAALNAAEAVALTKGAAESAEWKAARSAAFDWQLRRLIEMVSSSIYAG